jgi:hypothetical protein
MGAASLLFKDGSGAVCGSACMLIEERANGINPIIGSLGKGEGLITRVGAASDCMQMASLRVRLQ